jgi:hypothetical protein
MKVLFYGKGENKGRRSSFSLLIWSHFPQVARALCLLAFSSAHTRAWFHILWSWNSAASSLLYWQCAFASRSRWRETAQRGEGRGFCYDQIGWHCQQVPVAAVMAAGSMVIFFSSSTWEDLGGGSYSQSRYIFSPPPPWDSAGRAGFWAPSIIPFSFCSHKHTHSLFLLPQPF